MGEVQIQDAELCKLKQKVCAYLLACVSCIAVQAQAEGVCLLACVCVFGCACEAPAHLVHVEI